MAIKCVLRRRNPKTGQNEFFRKGESWTEILDEAFVFQTKTEGGKHKKYSDASDLLPVYLTLNGKPKIKEVPKKYYPPDAFLIVKRSGYGDNRVLGLYYEKEHAIEAIEVALKEWNSVYVKFRRIDGLEKGDIIRAYADKWSTEILIEKKKYNLYIQTSDL